jgi:hypothetical protein
VCFVIGIFVWELHGCLNSHQGTVIDKLRRDVCDVWADSNALFLLLHDSLTIDGIAPMLSDR